MDRETISGIVKAAASLQAAHKTVETSIVFFCHQLNKGESKVGI